ncbi:MAG: Amidohydrolase 3 [Acidobacteriaceae bacterium]|nr:Amidohydrolase 3 [Acidobacteriaceae bacterium]
MKPSKLSAFLLLSALPLCAQQSVAPDTIFLHGNILTGAHLQPNDPATTPARVSALAISHGTVTAAGTDAEILALKSPSTKIIDLNNAFAMPGFNDAHTHIAGAGQQKLTVDLDHVASLEEMQARIKSFAATLAPGAWITGGGWDHTLWPSKTLPTRQDLDAVTAGHPTVLSRTDGHIVVANTAALAAANITSATSDPAGGKIDHDAAGALTGIVRETPAVTLLNKVIPPPTREERRRALTYAINDALAHGVTSVQDLSDWEDFLALEDLEHANQLHLRVSEWLAFDTPVDVLKQRSSAHPADDLLLHTGMLKGFMDGSLGSRTAALKAPYTDDPKNSGIPRYDQKKLDSMASERAEAGFQLGFHAIGDRANDMALTAFERAQQAHAPGKLSDASRYRIEHAQVVSAGDFDRFAKLHVIASMQPSHLLTDMNWAAARLGPERARYSYAWRSFLDHHVTLAFGTDYPVESIDPFRGLYSAITRQNEAGILTSQPQEKITLNEALYAYTQASAFAENKEKIKGRLAPGFLADLVVLDRDITKATPQELLHAQVLETIVNGEVVYSRQSNTVADNTIHPTYIDDDADE